MTMAFGIKVEAAQDAACFGNVRAGAQFGKLVRRRGD